MRNQFISYILRPNQKPMNSNVMATLPFIDQSKILFRDSIFSPNIKMETMENRLIEEAYRQEWDRQIDRSTTNEEQRQICADIAKQLKKAKRDIAKERKNRREEPVQNEVVEPVDELDHVFREMAERYHAEQAEPAVAEPAVAEPAEEQDDLDRIFREMAERYHAEQALNPFVPEQPPNA